ncbi:uncharacterized protein J4E87_008706, partial [Alternaria ethzedia]|uniref:uncharacterized protein n=1 Tax=Alternaria ethzedia TaxID=181014 RepID=UPI0020C4C626
MAPTSSTTSLLDSLKAIEILKGLILDQVRAVHGRSYPTSHYTFSVTTSFHDESTSLAADMKYYAQAIIYTTPGSLAEWKMVAESDACDSTRLAMEMLYLDMQMQVGKIT